MINNLKSCLKAQAISKKINYSHITKRIEEEELLQYTARSPAISVATGEFETGGKHRAPSVTINSSA